MNDKTIWSKFSLLLIISVVLASCVKATPTPTQPPLTSTLPPTQQQATSAPTEPSAAPLVEINRTTYAHPEILVEADWVVSHLNDKTVRIIDAREALEGALTLYQAGHIPGAVFVDTFSALCCPSVIMGVDDFAQYMGKLGIGNDTTVVIYDTSGGIWAARMWWALRYYGHDEVKILNGGLYAWLGAGQPLETASPSVTPAVFHAEVQPQWIATMDEVKKAIDDPDVFIVDALTRPNYIGDLQQYDRPGHISTAVSLPAPDTLDSVSQKVLPPADLSRMLTRLGIDPAKRVITYCGGGYFGAQTAFVLYLMGFDKVGLYDGSLMQWARYPATSNPMEVDK